MSSTTQIIIGIVFFITSFILSQIITRKRIHTTSMKIIEDLHKKQALDVFSAIELNFTRSGLIPRGLRDFRPRALQELIQSGIVAETGSGKIYLKRPVLNDPAADSNASETSERR